VVIQEFDITVHYVKAKDNVLANFYILCQEWIDKVVRYFEGYKLILYFDLAIKNVVLFIHLDAVFFARYIIACFMLSITLYF
jgi:hypothetical protein